jgi:hypothetical protein
MQGSSPRDDGLWFKSIPFECVFLLLLQGDCSFPEEPPLKLTVLWGNWENVDFEKSGFVEQTIVAWRVPHGSTQRAVRRREHATDVRKLIRLFFFYQAWEWVIRKVRGSSFGS